MDTSSSQSSEGEKYDRVDLWCARCDKQFTSMKTLMHHLQNVHNKKSKRREQRRENKQYIKSKHKKKMPTCHYCGVLCMDMDTLDYHKSRCINRQKGRKTLAGRRADKKKSLLSRRQTERHTDDDMSDSKSLSYKCVHCKKQYSTKMGAKCHASYCRKNNEVYECNKCDFKSGYKYSLNRHYEQYHKKDKKENK